MGESDRLAELLERATRERRGDAGDTPFSDPEPSNADSGSNVDSGSAGLGDVWTRSVDRSPAPELVLAGEEITGGDWLPPDPGRHRGATRPPVLALPQSLRSADLGVRPIAVVALLVVALVAAGVFGFRWWQAEQGSAPVPLAPMRADADDSGTSGTTGSGEQGAGQGERMPSATDPAALTGAGAQAGAGGGGAGAVDAAPGETGPTELLVHVAGEVRAPGVIRLEPGARVHDAVEAAGGLGPEADTGRLNLARVVIDGERIWVPRPGEEVPEVAEPGGVGAPVGEPGTSPGGVAGGSTQQGPGPGGQPLVNLNTADRAGLEALPGVGPVTAEAIIQWRTEHGGFSTPDELLEISGIGEATLEKLRPHVTL